MKLSLLAASTSLLLAAGCTTNDAGPAVPVDPAVIYAQMCARCHGIDGHGDPQLKQTMPTLRDFSDPELRSRKNDDIEQVIMAGKNQMPGFGASLSLPKIQALTGHVRRLGGK
ncbi:MAG TPA: cytochrome c [Polyangia bacterium]|nr:cytochrome c [Polyangia bacterium]